MILTPRLVITTILGNTLICAYLRPMKYLLLALCSMIYASTTLYAAGCGAQYDQIQILIHPDNQPTEAHWSLRDYYTHALLDTGSRSQGDTVCIPKGTCILFTIHDDYGDGLCCNQGKGYYLIRVNGVTVDSGGSYTYRDALTIHCPQGTYCNTPIPAHKGVQTAPFRDAWYTYVTDKTGMWEISTCGLGNTCDTRLYTYQQCKGITYFDGNPGSNLYNDIGTGKGCDSLQARITGFLRAHDTLLIRIGDKDTSCTSTIRWRLAYLGEVRGCMDSSSCSFNPFATRPLASACKYPPSDACPLPDLMVSQPDLANTLKIDSVSVKDSTDCDYREGCVTGVGMRYVLRFSTKIYNIGRADYWIGSPYTDSALFEYDLCHGHYHFRAFVAHRIFDSKNKERLVGFKNGFCIQDHHCPKGILGIYGCNNLGITAGCDDTYDNTIPCQWIDVSELETGRYRLLVDVNWKQLPDKLGRIEYGYDNNKATVTIDITRNAYGTPTVKRVD
jgi:Lysyl oxidase